MAIKRISIEPDTLIRILNAARDGKGQRLIPVALDKFQCVRAEYDGKRNEFLVDVQSAAFDEAPGSGAARLPQTFNIQIKK